MASPIENLHISKNGNSHINVSFDYTGVADSFDTVMVLLVEQDGIGDNWSLRPREIQVMTDNGPMRSHELDFYNETYNSFWNQGSSAGSRDDTGNRRRVRRMPLPLGGHTVSMNIMYYAGQVDENYTSTIPGLEFYAVAAIVARVDNRPVVQLGDITYSNQLAGA